MQEQKENSDKSQQLIDQALQGQQYLDQSEINLKHFNNEYFYIIEKEWLYKWQDYVNYFENIEGEELDLKTFGKKNPGPINQYICSKSEYEFYKMKGEMGLKYDFFNQILTTNLAKRDCKIVDEECWLFFNKLYPGYTFKRPITIKNDKQKNNIDFLRPYIIFIDDSITANILSKSVSDLQKDKNPLKIYRLQMFKYWKIKDLKIFLYEFIQNQFGIKDIEIRLWKIDPSINSTVLDEKIISTIKKKNYKIKGNLIDETQYKDLYLKQFIKYNYSIFIEYKYIGNENWLFSKSSTQVGPEKKEQGYCEECEEKEFLNVSCLCKQVFYCSSKCKYYDQKFHSYICDIVYDSEDDETLLNKVVKNNGMLGLQNFQNCCYMNSILQCLFITEDFSQFFLQNLFIQQRKSQNKKSNYLNLKFAKLIKYVKLAQKKEFYARSFKNQIGNYDSNVNFLLYYLFYYQFRGSYQQDAQEFLNTLLDSLNEELLSIQSYYQRSQNEQQIINKIEIEQIDEQQKKKLNQNIQSQNNEEQKLQGFQLIENQQQQQQQQLNDQKNAFQTWSQIYYQNFSQILSNCFVGMFQSCLTCPNCKYTNISYEPFSVLSLPLKHKPIIEKMHVYYIPFNVSEKIDQFYIEYDNAIDSLNSFVQNAANIFKTDYKYLLPALCNNETINEFFRYNQEKIKVKEINKKITQSIYKNFVLFQLDQPLESYQQVDKHIIVEFSQNTKVMKQMMEIQQISIPRIIFINVLKPLSKIYQQIYTLFQNQYQQVLTYLKDVEENFEKQYMIKLQDEQNSIEESNNDVQEKSENQQQKKNNNNHNHQQTKPQKKSLIQKELEKNLPFAIRIISDKKKSSKQQTCNFCDSKICKNCILKYDAIQNLNEYIGNYKGQFNIEIYWTENQNPPKELMSHTFIKKSLQQFEKENQQLKQNLLQQEIQNKQLSELNKKIVFNNSNFAILEECLLQFQEPEQLSLENAFNCPKCQTSQQAIKCQKIYYCPKYFIIQLKRFSTNNRGNRVKNNQKILFDQFLQMEELCYDVSPHLISQNNKQNKKNITYELYAIVKHEGSLDKGHYIAYCKQQNEWYKYDDNIIEIVEIKEVINNKDAYILFYQHHPTII